MKVGILTFHRAINYGAALQAYALVKKLDELGFDAEIIDYRNPHIEKGFHKFSFSKVNSPKKALSYIYGYSRMRKKKNAFKCFIKSVPVSKPYYDANLLKLADYDIFITGSDQVWNPDCTDFDKTYFLDFAKSKQKASYGASFGISVLDKKYEQQIGELIKDFEYIGVREKNGVDIVKNISGKEATVVLDPTLLLDNVWWNKLAKPLRYSKEKFLLVYMLANSPSLIEFAEKIAKKRNLDIVYIGSGRRKNIIYAKEIGPYEFVDLFAKAEMVVTNSFHGTAFSINLNKEFYVELKKSKKSRNSRIENLLELLNLKDRVIGENKEAINNINYNNVNKKLEEEREKSLDFIRSLNRK